MRNYRWTLMRVPLSAKQSDVNDKTEFKFVLVYV